MKKIIQLISLICIHCTVFSQNLPHQWTVDDTNHRLTIGDVVETGIFNVDVIDTLYLNFENTNWYNTLVSYYTAGTELTATMTFQGEVFEQVGVSFKGQTSYSMIQSEEKKSFNIRLDANIDGQDIDGYDVLNLNNCFQDESFLREFFYLYLIRHQIPAASCAFVELVINGESWGLYPMVQQLDGSFVEDWFLSKNGTRWRADSETQTGGGPGGGGPSWGDGTAALNDLGTDQSEYEQYYTLKSSTVADPWANLISTCDVLNNTAAGNMTTEIPTVLDVDRTLWFLACENVFGDDDSYIYKGKMDYYLYWEIETGRMVPLEFDGNSVLVNGSANWGVFYHANDVDYPLLNKLLAVPEYRQRYLAHYRTIIEELVDPALANGTIATFGEFIDPHVYADTKKLYTYQEFTDGIEDLHDRLQTRRNLVMTNAELNVTGATISNVVLHTAAGDWQSPVADTPVLITAVVASADGIDHVNLYYSNELVGNFTKIVMMDDGLSNDGSAGDGLYGGTIPGMEFGTVVRFYVEAVEANSALTASYEPKGAEHDVFYYNVLTSWASSTDVVINEVMASNSATAQDEQSQFEDWIELYNRGTSPVDLTNYYITDNSWDITKWQIPDGTIIAPDSYLILWSDEDEVDGVYHTNFKLSASGETLTLLNNNGEIADQTIFGEQISDLGFARNPNGVGNFVIQDPTFSSNNNITIDVLESTTTNRVAVYPNPCNDVLNIRTNNSIAELVVSNVEGQIISLQNNQRTLDTSGLSSGIYFVQIRFIDGSMDVLKIIRQ